MGQKQIEQLFFEHPGRRFYLRQMAAITKTPKTSVSRFLLDLLRKGLITRHKNKPYDLYSASSNSLHRFYKTQHILEKLHKSGLIDYLIEQLHPKAIILFGSCAKGEYEKSSDIDLFIIAKQEKLHLRPFERRLGHPVQTHFYDDLSGVPDNLANNVANGIKLHGFLRISERKT